MPAQSNLSWFTGVKFITSSFSNSHAIIYEARCDYKLLIILYILYYIVCQEILCSFLLWTVIYLYSRLSEWCSAGCKRYCTSSKLVLYKSNIIFYFSSFLFSSVPSMWYIVICFDNFTSSRGVKLLYDLILYLYHNKIYLIHTSVLASYPVLHQWLKPGLN